MGDGRGSRGEAPRHQFREVDGGQVVCRGGESKPLELKIRGFYVDTRLKELTTGPAHNLTDRPLVVRRVFRLQ